MFDLKKFIVFFFLAISIAFAINKNIYASDLYRFNSGHVASKVNMSINNLDSSGNYKYYGVDIGIFESNTLSGPFTVKSDKVTRMETNSTQIDINLGNQTDYELEKYYKIAYRVLYTRINSEEIVIQDFNNGKEGWILLQNGGEDLWFTIETMPTAAAVSSSGASTSNSTFEVFADFVSDSTGGVSSVKFPTWTEANGQDDIIWYNGAKEVTPYSLYKYDYDQNVIWTYHGFDIPVSTSSYYTFSFDALVTTDTNTPNSGTTFIANGENGFSHAFNYDNTKKGQWQHFEYRAIPTTSTARLLLYPTWSIIPATTGNIIYKDVKFIKDGTTTNLFTQPSDNSGFSIKGNGIFDVTNERWKATINKNNHNNEDGKYITHAYAYDDIGTNQIIGSTSVLIDTIPPTDPVISISPLTYTTGNITVTITYPADATTKVYNIDGGNSLVYTEPYTVSKNCTIAASCLDSVGNWSNETSLQINNIHKIPKLNTPTLSKEIYSGLDTELSATGEDIVDASYRIFYTTEITAPVIIDGGDNPGADWVDSDIAESMNVTGTTDISKTILQNMFQDKNWTHVVFKVGVGSETGDWVIKYTTAHSLINPNEIIGYIGHNQIINSQPESHPENTIYTFNDGDTLTYRAEFDVLKPNEISDMNIYFDLNYYNKYGIEFIPDKIKLLESKNATILQEYNFDSSNPMTKLIEKEQADAKNRYYISIDNTLINEIKRYFIEYSGTLNVESNYYGETEEITNEVQIEVITPQNNYGDFINEKYPTRKRKINTNVIRGKKYY